MMPGERITTRGMATRRVRTALDLSAPGKRVGTLDLTHSDNRHSFSVIPIPIAVLVGDTGPTVLLAAGTHGDEYEGQVILRRLIHAVDPARLRGRLIVLPALNLPAVLDDARVSPLDGGNLNRVFPGRDGGPPTEAIADFVTTQLLPLCAAGLDLHSGGRAARLLPSAFLSLTDHPQAGPHSLAMAEAFAAPYTLVMPAADYPEAVDPIAHQAGIPFLSTELSGGAGVDIEATAIGMAGVRRVLARLGVLPPAAVAAPPPATVYLDGARARPVTATVTGLFEPLCRLGETVEAGQPAGRVYPLEEIDRPPLTMTCAADGLVAALRATARVRPGDHLCLIAPKITRAAIPI